MAVNCKGVAVSHGGMAARLRDVARFGLLFTPSSNKTAHTQIISERFLRRILTNGRTDLGNDLGLRTSARLARPRCLPVGRGDKKRNVLQRWIWRTNPLRRSAEGCGPRSHPSEPARRSGPLLVPEASRVSLY